MTALSVALTGNPNTGKSTIFNELTGARQKIGNWPGVTVDKKVGVIEHNGRKISVIDLPGTYSINARSQEEQVVSDYFKTNKPDIVVNIIDAANIARNLFLTIQLMENGIPLILNLNMMDEAQRHGIKIDMKKLEDAFGMPVTNTVGRSNKSVRKLLDVFTNAVMTNYKPSKLINDHIERVHNIEHSGLAAAKIEEEVIAARYDLIDKIMASAVTVSATDKTLTEKLDSYLANGVSSLMIMVAAFYLMFQIAFNWIGQPLADIVGEFFDETLAPAAAAAMAEAGVADWMQSLVSDGIIAGVGAVINFVPLIFTLFICLSFLDGTGYMARVAFIMDPIMRRVGLTGKGIMPLIMGFGCGVPAVMASRALDTHKDRMISIFVTPFITCNAKVPIIALFAAMFFPDNVANVVFAMYFVGIITAIIMAKILSSTMFKEQQSTFLLELPPYRLPDIKTVLLEAWDKGKGYLIKAGTIIFAMSVIIWFLSSFNSDGMTEDMDNSYLASIGSATSVIFAPQGFDTWEAGAAVVTGVLAKEAVVSTMGILYGADEVSTEPDEANEAAETMLATSMAGAFTPLSALAFMVFSLLYSPCMTALGTIKKEAQGFKWMAFVFFYTTAVAWGVSLIVYQGGKLLGFE
ncbi:MAG: ferrous iron transport protein B [Quinella sp. 1Q5]|nr:ferrous iron transport protein B [Quinella sp. 1Q5]